jgi:hypothetical protein
MAVGTPIRLRRAQIAVELEASEGSAETLVAADAKIKAENVTYTPDLPFYPRNAVSASFSPFTGTSGGPRMAEISFETMLSGSGTAATPPAFTDAIRACGMDEAITTTVTYTPVSTVTVGGDGGSATVGFYTDGVLYTIHGARGNFRLILNSGEPGKIAFNFRGVYNEPTDTDLLVPTYYTTVPPAIVSGSMQLDSQALKYKSLEFDLGNQLADRADPSATEGAYSVCITGREPTGTMDPEMLAIATYNFFNKLTTNAEGAFTLTIGSVSGNKYVITAPKVQYTAVEPGDRDGLQVAGLTFQLNRSANAGEDELSIVHST